MIVRDKRELDTIRKNLYYSAEQAVLNIKLCAEQNPKVTQKNFSAKIVKNVQN